MKGPRFAPKGQWFAPLTLCCALIHTAPAQRDAHAMPGMRMGETTGAAAQDAAPDTTRSDEQDASARRAAESLRNSAAQQRSQGAGPPDAASDALSLHRDTQRLQEAEFPSLHTGANLPAPELLTDLKERPALPLQQFLLWAEQGNPTLQQADAVRRRDEQLGRQAALPPNPTLGYSGEHIRGGSYHGGEQGAFVQQTVVLGGKLGLRREVYRQTAAADAAEQDVQRYRIRSDVQSSFYSALAAQATVEVRQKLATLATDAVETSHHLANLGQADAPDVLQAEVELEQARIDFVEAQRVYLQRFAVLSALCNQPSLPAAHIDGDLENAPELDAEAAVAKVLAESPELQRAERQTGVAEARVKQARREVVPNLNLTAGEWNSGEPLDGTGRRAGWMSFAQAGVDLPLWNRNQGNTGAAKAERERAQAEVTRTRLMLKRDAEPLAQGYLSARFQVERYRTQLLPRAQRAYQLYSMKYGQMAAAYPQVLLSQRTLFNLRIAYLHALEMQWQSAIRLQNYTLAGGLEQPMDAPPESTMLNLPTGGAQ